MTLQTALLDISDERWLQFVSLQPSASIFHHPAWSRLLASSYGFHPFIAAVVNPDGRIRAGLPMVEITGRLHGESWVSLPFTDYCWPLYSDAQSLEWLLDSLYTYYDQRRLRRLEIRSELPKSRDLEYEYVRHVVNLCPDVDAVSNRFNPMHLRNIKIALRKDVRIELGNSQEHVDAFYRLQVLTRRRKGLPVQPRKFFNLLKTNILDNELGFILLAHRGEECLAGAVFLHWQRTLTYKYGASSSEGRNFRPNNLILWTAVQWGCDNGYAILDLGRTELENNGLRRFKNGWGAEEIPLGYSRWPKSDRHSSADQVISVLMALIRNSPTFVCQLAGELFYGDFA